MVGVLFERFLIVIPGLIHPPDLFPGYEVMDTVLWEGVISGSSSPSLSGYDMFGAVSRRIEQASMTGMS